MDASDYNIGVVTSQVRKTILFFIRKLTGPQTQYKVTEKDLLSMVEKLK